MQGVGVAAGRGGEVGDIVVTGGDVLGDAQRGGHPQAPRRGQVQHLLEVYHRWMLSVRHAGAAARSALILLSRLRPGSWRKRTAAVTVVVRRPDRRSAGLVTEIAYRTGEQSRTSVEKILPGPGTGLWVNLNRDAFRSFGWAGQVRQVPGSWSPGRPGARDRVRRGSRARGGLVRAGRGALLPRAPLALLRDDLVPVEAACGGSRCLPAGTVARGADSAGCADGDGGLPDRQMVDGPRPDPAVTAAARALARGSRWVRCPTGSGCCLVTLRRRFAAQVGLTPKRFGRVQRLQRVVRRLDGRAQVDWAATAARHGYCDQAHLTDEFRDLVGVTRPGTSGPGSRAEPSEVRCSLIGSRRSPVPRTSSGPRWRSLD